MDFLESTNWSYVAMVAAAASLVYAVVLTRWIMSQSAGTDRMQQLSKAVQDLFTQIHVSFPVDFQEIIVHQIINKIYRFPR